MNLPTNHQLIEHDGKPVAVVVPYSDYVSMADAKPSPEWRIPHEVIKMMVEDDMSAIAAWRKYRGRSQLWMAQQMGTTQPSYSQLESRKFYKARTETQEKLLALLEINRQQIVELEED